MGGPEPTAGERTIDEPIVQLPPVHLSGFLQLLLLGVCRVRVCSMREEPCLQDICLLLAVVGTCAVIAHYVCLILGLGCAADPQPL